MSESISILEQFIETEYIHNEQMGSPDMSGAIRDLLTDLMHLGETHKVDIYKRLGDAREVYNVEADEE